MLFIFKLSCTVQKWRMCLQPPRRFNFCGSNRVIMDNRTEVKFGRTLRQMITYIKFWNVQSWNPLAESRDSRGAGWVSLSRINANYRRTQQGKDKLAMWWSKQTREQGASKPKNKNKIRISQKNTLTRLERLLKKMQRYLHHHSSAKVFWVVARELLCSVSVCVIRLGKA